VKIGFRNPTSLPGCDNPHDAVQENGTYGGHSVEALNFSASESPLLARRSHELLPKLFKQRARYEEAHDKPGYQRRDLGLRLSSCRTLSRGCRV
jgi:hypothetical protein